MKTYKNSAEALKAVQKMKKNGETYTPVQVFNSAQRSEAWARKSGNPIQKSVWKKVKALAEQEMLRAYAQAKANGEMIPCDQNCMESFSSDCDCSCGGVNHGVHLESAVAS